MITCAAEFAGLRLRYLIARRIFCSRCAGIDTQSWTFPTDDSACINLAEDITPATPFTLGAGESIMYLRACYLVRPIFFRPPLSGCGCHLMTLDCFALRATTGFVNE